MLHGRFFVGQLAAGSKDMQEMILLGVFIAALYYLYRKLIKNRGCNCGSKGCDSSISANKDSSDSSKS